MLPKFSWLISSFGYANHFQNSISAERQKELDNYTARRERPGEINWNYRAAALGTLILRFDGEFDLLFVHTRMSLVRIFLSTNMYILFSSEKKTALDSYEGVIKFHIHMISRAAKSFFLSVHRILMNSFIQAFL